MKTSAPEYYREEFRRAPLRDTLSFMCQRNLAVFLRCKSITEGVSYAALIRRYLHSAAIAEGYDPDQ